MKHLSFHKHTLKSISLTPPGFMCVALVFVATSRSVHHLDRLWIQETCVVIIISIKNTSEEKL